MNTKRNISRLLSIIFLVLTSVTAFPQVTIFGDSLSCEGETIRLFAMGPESYVDEGGVPIIGVGDLLCTDGSTVKPDDYASSGKTAMGVVFYVDTTGAHGWAASLRTPGGNGCIWNNKSNVTNLPDIDNYEEALADTCGMANTIAIKDYYGENFDDCPAVYRCYYYNHNTGQVGNVHYGWYLPAIGQLRKLYSVIHFINPSIAIAGGTQIPTNKNGMHAPWWLWSSTENSDINSWTVNDFGWVFYVQKNSNAASCRAVISF